MKRKALLLLGLFILTSLSYKKEVRSHDPNDLIKPGKIFIQNKYLYVNDIGRGIHIYDSREKSNPIHLSFIPIPGNYDIAIKNSYLYADSHSDLEVYNISDKENPKLETSVGHIFSYAPDFSWEEGFISNGSGSLGCFNSTTPQTYSSESTSGKGGSMARFAVYENYLYCVDSSNLIVFNIEDNHNPVYKNQMRVSWDIETIYPAKGHLFIGSESGMFIYSIENPEDPEYLSQFTHARACDPVVVNGDYAYVTLRSGSRCTGSNDQLDVINISEISKPKLEKSYELFNPHGLDVDNQYLYICDGRKGLRILNIKDIRDINEINRIEKIGKTYDAILTDEKILYITSSKGIYLYDVNNVENVSQLGLIEIE